MTPVRVAVVDDSAFVRGAVTKIVSEDRRLVLAGSCDTGECLLAHLDEWQPDVITLDLIMPGMGGMSTLDRLMAVRPTPVIILSARSGEGAPLTLEALSRGAADFIDKQAYSLMDFTALRTVLLDKILALAGATPTAPPAQSRQPTLPTPHGAAAAHGGFDILLIGASTGGPAAIERLFTDLGPALPVPAVVVQHLPEGFTQPFAARLNQRLALRVAVCGDGAKLHAGSICIAPTGFHLRLDNGADGATAWLESPNPGDLHTPSVDFLFESGAETFGPRALAVLLTGMGRDGAAGMVSLANAGAYTIAQDAASCVIYGMPRAAVDLHAVREIVELEKLGRRLAALLHEPSELRSPASGETLYRSRPSTPTNAKRSKSRAAGRRRPKA